MIRASVAALSLLLVVGLVACGSGSPGDAPPAIRYGQDVCDECGMIISEERFAAAYVTVDGEARRFDDVGDLLAYRAEHGEDVAAYWVHDYDSADWVRADEARFVRSEVRTPMGSGLVAFADAKRAERLAAEGGGKAMGWDELLSRFAAGDLGPHGMAGMEPGDGGEGMSP